MSSSAIMSSDVMTRHASSRALEPRTDRHCSSSARPKLMSESCERAEDDRRPALLRRSAPRGSDPQGAVDPRSGDLFPDLELQRLEVEDHELPHGLGLAFLLVGALLEIAGQLDAVALPEPEGEAFPIHAVVPA